MLPRYPLFQAVLVAFLAHYVAHAWNTGHIGVVSECKVPWKKHSVIRNDALSKVPRGGGEQANEDRVEGTHSEDEPQSQDTLDEDDHTSQDTTNGEESQTEMQSPQATTFLSALPQERKVRHTSDVIVNLKGKNSALKEESLELRELISNRTQSYMEELSQSHGKLTHPRRVLHYVAPKIPAIKHSPDLMLRVQSFKGGTDTGVAACAIGTVARLCELYDRRNLQDNDADEEAMVSVGSEIVRDRRFQQLVECVLCGVDLKKRKQEAEEMKGNETSIETSDSRDIEEVLDEEEAEIDEGLSVQDACRAAWGIAVLTGFHTQSFSDVATEDILTALALRNRELLLARLQLLREGDTLKEDNEGTLTLVERLDRDAEELAEDAASAMWTFACVKACTGVRSVALFETCCTILCQIPLDLRERALEAKEGLDGSSFEVNDVIEKLERSEIDHFSNDATDELNITSLSAPNMNATDDAETSDISKDALLDWLSPNEVTDVLWALALHGSTVDTDSKEEIALSETAAAFREIAFDRLLGWLRRDLDIIDEVKQSDTNSSVLRPEDIETEFIKLDGSDISMGVAGATQGEMMVEVVDAAALLASSTTMETEVVNTDISVKDDHEGVDVGQVQVVDAATLLTCTPEEVSLDMETEVVVTSKTSPCYEASTEPADSFGQPTVSAVCQDSPSPPDTERNRNSVDYDMAALLRSGQLSFSPHDLCSIAWAVTDLRDPLRFLIVDLITQMFASFGRVSLESLSMADLSNLAWAIARSAPQKKALSWSEYSETPAAIVTRWTAETTLSRLGIDGHILEDHDVALAVRSVLQEFQPPELGRLMWSLACTVSNHVDPFEPTKERDVAVSQLSMLALLTAGTNLSIFSTEDLTRIAWAFLELCDTKEALSQPLVAESLGSILAVIETSLLAWESGPRAKSALLDIKRAEDSLHFSTFFGKSRFPLPLLNQRIHEQEDEDGEPKVRKAALPLLRDLPVDPASLCKLSSGFSRLSQEQRNIVGGWTFVRVAVRLLSSKNGQLMERCPLIDVIGLCHACAISEVNGRERGQVVRLFAGRVVQFMNDALDPDRDTHGKAAERLARASPWEVSTLLWSLGELGSRHSTTDENRRMAHRKLRLVTDRPLLSDDELHSLSAASAVNLLHGIASMEMTSSDPAFVRIVLQAVEGKVESLQSGQELTVLSQTLAKLRRSVERLEQQSSEEASASTSGKNARDDGSGSDQTENAIGSGIDELAVIEHNSTMIRNAILGSTNQLLATVAELAPAKIHDLSAEEMREFLLVFSMLPFQADGLVDAIEEETARRMKVLGFKGPMESVQELARRAFDSSLLASSSLSGESENASTVDTIKNGIKAIFGVHDISEEASEEDVERLAEVADTVQHTTTLTRETLGRMEQIRQGTGTDTETLLRGVEQGTALELGRCKELIACYRRIDFATGSQECRYDSARRRDISKRILSRLFP